MSRQAVTWVGDGMGIGYRDDDYREDPICMGVVRAGAHVSGAA